jgi:hypothetical protein
VNRLDVYADLFDDDLTGVADKLDESVGTGREFGGPANVKIASTCTNVSIELVPSVRFELTLHGF